MIYKLFHGGVKVNLGAKTSEDLHLIQRVESRNAAWQAGPCYEHQSKA